MVILFDDLPDRNGKEGERRRGKALAILRARRAVLVRELQTAALSVALERGIVTADDVRALVAIPLDVSSKLNGAAFRELADAGFLRRVGFIASTRPAAHARPLSQWQLVDAAGATAWLTAHPIS